MQNEKFRSIKDNRRRLQRREGIRVPMRGREEGGGWWWRLGGWCQAPKRRDDSLDNMRPQDPLLPPFQITRSVVQNSSSAIPRPTIVVSNVSHQPLNLGQSACPLIDTAGTHADLKVGWGRRVTSNKKGGLEMTVKDDCKVATAPSVSVIVIAVQLLSRVQLCHLMDFPVHRQLPEPAQTHVHWVSDAIQPSSIYISIMHI